MKHNRRRRAHQVAHVAYSTSQTAPGGRPSIAAPHRLRVIDIEIRTGSSTTTTATTRAVDSNTEQSRFAARQKPALAGNRRRHGSAQK